MSIPESQLETWSHQGSITQSSSTYQSVKAVLESSTTPYSDKNFEIFLQGSYGNDTNIYAESDVDIVIRLDSTFYKDLSKLSKSEQDIYNSSFSVATYELSTFKNDVVSVLRQAYGSDVTVGDKAIQIAPRNGRRKTDVIVASQYRSYQSFQSQTNQSYIEGITFRTLAGVEIINYPKQHSKNLTVKHQQASSWFKPVARILKNMRGRMVSDGLIASNIAPSYYVEGLLYNVPISEFGKTYEDSVINSINWILKADRSKFVCVNEQYFLCHPSSPVTWRSENLDTFLNGTVHLWKNW
jgi:hypothetical protein